MTFSNGAEAVLSGDVADSDALVFTYTVGSESTDHVTVTGLVGHVQDRAHNDLTETVTFDPASHASPASVHFEEHSHLGDKAFMIL